MNEAALSILVQVFLDAHLFLLGKCLGVEQLGQKVGVYLVF
jgi:hypothetical protein